MIVDTYHTGLPSQDPGAAHMAVLTKDHMGQHAVYEGIVRLPVPPNDPSYADLRANAALWVADRGIKCPYRKALTYWPGLKEEEYRR